MRTDCRSFVASREWPTWLLIVGCHGAWLAALLGRDAPGPAWVLLAVPLVTLHSSLQHEALHGHPTRSRRLNELLVFPALGLFVPYRRFRDLHVRHHVDERLTDPYDDPESWYVGAGDWERAGPVLRALLGANATLLGRVTLGPALALAGFWHAECRAARAGEPGVRRAWLLHVAALLPVVAALAAAGVPLWFYALGVAYPAMSLLMVRTFVEHRAAERVGERTVVVEAGPVMSLLFLNNNLHAVHHAAPSVPWYALPARWRATRGATLEANGGYRYPGGYAEVAARWLVARREPVVHPFIGASPAATAAPRAVRRRRAPRS